MTIAHREHTETERHAIRLRSAAYEICEAVKRKGCRCKHELNGPCDEMTLAACKADEKLSADSVTRYVRKGEGA